MNKKDGESPTKIGKSPSSIYYVLFFTFYLQLSLL